MDPSFKQKTYSAMCTMNMPTNLLENKDEADLGDCVAICLRDFNFPLDFHRVGFNKKMAQKSSLILSNSSGDVIQLPIAGTHDFEGRLVLSFETANDYRIKSSEQLSLLAIAVNGAVNGEPLEEFVSRVT